MMADKQSKKIQTDTAVSRRRFLTIVWIGLGLTALLEAIWMAVAFLKPSGNRSRSSDTDTVITAGPVDTFLPGSVTAFPRGRFYLARMDDGGFLALSRSCPHLGCTLPWIEEQKQFVCPCHSSAFDMRGEVASTPAPRAMDRFRVAIENEVVRVYTRSTIKRNRFKPDQVVYASKT